MSSKLLFSTSESIPDFRADSVHVLGDSLSLSLYSLSLYSLSLSFIPFSLVVS